MDSSATRNVLPPEFTSVQTSLLGMGEACDLLLTKKTGKVDVTSEISFHKAVTSVLLADLPYFW